MGQNYLEVAERLRAYRNALHRTQEEMSVHMGVTQGHYAKLESGANVISYDCLKTFEMNGGDVHFLITGKRLEKGVLDDYINQCGTEWGKRQIFWLIVWLLGIGLELEEGAEQELSEAAYRNLGLVRLAKEKPGNIWKNMRELNKATQAQMAEILDINIKRYLRLEKKITRPDAEILRRVYTRLLYAPMLVLESSWYYLGEGNGIWEGFSDASRGRLEELLGQALEIVREGERNVKGKSR